MFIRYLLTTIFIKIQEYTFDLIYNIYFTDIFVFDVLYILYLYQHKYNIANIFYLI